jgi:hypothetical protein
MARKLRPECPDAIYHIMNRGDRREAIVLDDGDRRCFLQTLSEACDKTGWQGKVPLQGQDWQVGLVEDPNHLGSTEESFLLLLLLLKPNRSLQAWWVVVPLVFSVGHNLRYHGWLAVAIFRLLLGPSNLP